jgi:HK97 gp10 family phage protein
MKLKSTATFRAGDWSRFEAKLVPKLIKAADAGAGAVLDISQGLVPVRSGELKASGRKTVEWKGSKVTGYVEYTAPHAAFNEFGTGQRGEASGHGAPGITYSQDWPGMTGKPFLRPALDQGQAAVLEAAKEALK